MKKLFLRTVVLSSVLIALGIFKPTPVQAQCFHLGQAFECNGLPDGTSSVSFNPDGTINLSNGQIVPGDFFNMPFRVPELDTTPTIIIPSPDRPPITFFPTTADGINALTAFSHALDREEEYQQTSFIFNKRLANRWLLRGNTAWQDWEWDSSVGDESGKSGDLPYDPELARQLLEEAGWVETPSGKRQYVTKETRIELVRSQVSDVDAPSTYKQEFLGGIEFEVARSVSLGVRYIHRTIPRVLEDVEPLSLTAYDIPAQGEGAAKGVSLRDVEGVKMSLENGIDQMDSQNAPIPILPFVPSIEPPSQAPAPFIKSSEPSDNREVM